MALNLLLSYAHAATTDLARVRKATCGRILIDSGAFTAHTTGKTISLDAFAAYLEQWNGCWDHAVTLDVIGDPAASAVNTRKLHARGLPVMPVFTRGGRLEEFDAMVRECGYVCAGGLVGLPPKEQVKRVAMLQRRAEHLGGGIHALGIGSLATIGESRPYSADSSNSKAYLQRFGMISYFNGRRIKMTPSPGNPKFQQLMRADRDLLRAHGVDVATLVRANRMPSANSRNPAGSALLQATLLAVAAADEHGRRSQTVPAPALGLAPGPHLYVAAIATPELSAVETLTTRMHGDEPPPIWRRYGSAHACHGDAA